MAGQGVVIRDDFIGKAQVYLFLAARREHAIPRQSQMLSLRMSKWVWITMYILPCILKHAITDIEYSKEDGSIHSPLVAYASMLGLLSSCPPFVIFIWFTMVHMDGSASQFWDFYKQQGLHGFLRIWPKPTLIAWKLIASYAAFEAALQLFLPGERVTGPVSPAGNVPVYKANEMAALSFASFYISRFSQIVGWKMEAWVEIFLGQLQGQFLLQMAFLLNQ